MRLRLFFLLVVLAGMSAAQDTNFPVGPQYLMPNVSPMELRPIATPSLSFGTGLSDAYATATELSVSQVPAPAAETPGNAFLGDVYWGPHKSSDVTARRIETPSLAADQTAYYYYATAGLAANALSEPPSVPIEPLTEPSVVEITSTGVPLDLPPSVGNPGVTGTADVQSLLNRGYGLPLGDFARSMKSKKRPSARVFTNDDLQRK